MYKNKILSIGIPTYNGEKFIIEALKSVVSQINNEIIDYVEIVISDNASSDNTKIIVAEFIKKYPLISIIYFRYNENKGFDVNYDNIFKKSTAEYVWTIGDDDCLCDGSIAIVLNLLKENSLAAIQVNFKKYDLNLQKIVETIEISHDILCENGNVFFANSKGRWGAIASLIIKKNHWTAIDLKYAFGTQTIFAYALFEIILNRPSYIMAMPLVKVRDGSVKSVKLGDGDAKIITALASSLLYINLLNAGYDKYIIKTALKKDRRYIFQGIAEAKYWGIKNKIYIIKKLIFSHNSIELWIKWIPIILFSNKIYRYLYIFKKNVSVKLKPYEKFFKNQLFQMKLNFRKFK